MKKTSAKEKLLIKEKSASHPALKQLQTKNVKERAVAKTSMWAEEIETIKNQVFNDTREAAEALVQAVTSKGFVLTESEKNILIGTLEEDPALSIFLKFKP